MTHIFSRSDRAVWHGRALIALPLMLALAGCGGVPAGQVQAHVNGREISDRAVAAELASANLADGDAGAARAALDKVIARDLIVEEARREGLDKTPDYLALRDRADDLVLADMMVRRWAGTLTAPGQAEIDHYVAANPLRFDQRALIAVDQIEASGQGPAVAALAPLHNMDAVEAMLRTSRASVRRIAQVLDTALIDQATARRLVTAPPGEPIVLAAPAKGGADWRIIAVTRNDPAPIPADMRASLAGEALRQQQIAHRLDALRSGARIAYRADLDPAAKAAN